MSKRAGCGNVDVAGYTTLSATKSHHPSLPVTV